MAASVARHVGDYRRGGRCRREGRVQLGALQFGLMAMGLFGGLSIFLFGMELMTEATTPLRTYEPFIDLMRQMDNPILGLLVSAAFTAVVQSSSATTGVIIVLASQGFISLAFNSLVSAFVALTWASTLSLAVTMLLMMGLGVATIFSYFRLTRHP